MNWTKGEVRTLPMKNLFPQYGKAPPPESKDERGERGREPVARGKGEKNLEVQGTPRPATMIHPHEKPAHDSAYYLRPLIRGYFHARRSL